MGTVESLNPESLSVDKVLDASGLNCPLPILKARKALGEIDAGQILKVTSTDPGSVKDFDAFCRQTGNEIVASSSHGDTYEFMIRKF